MPNLIFDQQDSKGAVRDTDFKVGAIGSILFPDDNLSRLEREAVLLEPMAFPGHALRNATATMNRKFADTYSKRLVTLSQKKSGRFLDIPFGPISVNLSNDIAFGFAIVPFVFYKATNGSQLEVSRPIFLQTRIVDIVLPYAVRIYGKAPEITYRKVPGGYHGEIKTSTKDSVACYVLSAENHAFIN